MTTLRMKGVRCASLEDFRNNFDFSNARDYLRQGRLSQWVRELGESDLADELDELKVADYSDKTLMDNFIGIFSLPIELAQPDEPVGAAKTERSRRSRRPASEAAPKAAPAAKAAVAKKAAPKAAPAKKAVSKAAPAAKAAVAKKAAPEVAPAKKAVSKAAPAAKSTPAKKAASTKTGSAKRVVYEGFFPDTPVEPTQENIDRCLRIKATLKIIGHQALLAIPPKMRALVSAPIKITPDTLLDKICPAARSVWYGTEAKTYGLAGALNTACGYNGEYPGRFKYPGFGHTGLTEDTFWHPAYFETVGQLVEYLSTNEKENILLKFSAAELARLNEEKF